MKTPQVSPYKRFVGLLEKMNRIEHIIENGKLSAEKELELRLEKITLFHQMENLSKEMKGYYN